MRNNDPWHNLFCSGDEIGPVNDKETLLFCWDPKGRRAFVTEWILAFPRTKDGEFSNESLASQHNRFTLFKACPKRPVCGLFCFYILFYFIIVVSASTELRSMEVLIKYATSTCDGD